MSLASLKLHHNWNGNSGGIIQAIFFTERGLFNQMNNPHPSPCAVIHEEPLTGTGASYFKSNRGTLCYY